MAVAIPQVVLDTTAIVGAGFGRSGPFAHLLRDAGDGRVKVIVPEVVIGEAVFVYRRDLFDVRDALERLPPLMRAAGYGWDLLQRPALVRRMESDLRHRLDEAGIEIVEAPRIDVDVLVRRIHERRKPTKQLSVDKTGRELRDQTEGFRDQLVWEHVRSAAEDGPVVFISDNTHDFGVKKSRHGGRADVHPQLLEDLEEDRDTGRSSGHVELMLNIAAFVDEYLKDEDIVEDMQHLLDGGAGELASDEVRRLVNEDGLTMDSFTPPVAVQGDVEEATLTALSGPLEPSLVDVYLESAEGERREYGVTLMLVGEGAVQWLVSAPAPWDYELFASLVEGDTAGGGFIHDVDTTPVQITVYGRYRPSEDEWVALEVEPAEQTADEAERRNREHDAYLIAREQDLGLLPSDEEIESLEQAH